MRIQVRDCFLSGAVVLLLLGSSGCSSSGPPAREDILAMPKDELYGASMKGLVYEFRAKFRKHGIPAAKEALPVLLENFDGFEKQDVGSHLETYQQIVDKLQSLQTTLEGSPTREAVSEQVDDIGSLADQLPGEADPNPRVE